MRDSFSFTNSLHFSFDLAPLDLDVSQAVPVGLILNEAIINSVKYASRGNKNTRICISLDIMENDQLLFIVADNGPGFPP